MSSDGKNVAGCAVVVLQILIVTPLWFYLLYQILVRVDATTPMWVAYWVYAPLGFILGSLSKIIEKW